MGKILSLFFLSSCIVVVARFFFIHLLLDYCYTTHIIS
jgi:hypothetical protein